MKVLSVIPARYSSTRLPGKPLAEIQGRPMIQWVYDAVRRARLVDRVIVATDDRRIEDAVHGFGGEAIITPGHIQSGTDRMAYVAQTISADFYLNVQGDEPLMDPETLDSTLGLIRSGRFEMATAMTPLKSIEELQSPNIVKVLVDSRGRAVYFSRFPIPYSVGTPDLESNLWVSRRHIGVYAFTRTGLLSYSGLKPSSWEKAESLEQLRALASGMEIDVVEVQSGSIGVDTLEDLELVRKKVSGRT